MSICLKTISLSLLALALAYGVHGQKTSTYLQERYILLPKEVRIEPKSLPPNVILKAQRLEPARGFTFYSNMGITWVLPQSSVKGRSIRIESGRPRPKDVDRTFRYCSCESSAEAQSSDCSLALNEENNFGCTGHCNFTGRLVPCAPLDRHLYYIKG